MPPMRAPERLASATEDKYEFLGVGAVGGMGEVYAVRHRLLGELRAVKVMHEASRLDRQLRQRFLLEARMAARLRHPNLVQLFDLAFHENGTAYMVLEWIEGLDLARVLDQYGPPSVADALEIARQTLSALDYLHGKGIVHRDISADNLMVVESEDHGLQIKIIDLGIAKSINTDSGLTRKGLFVGKLRYAPPEALDTDSHPAAPDPRSDLYSFGVVFYEVLTGTSPIAGSSESELLASHLLKPPRPFSETDPEGRVPDPLREIVLKCLKKDPAERFQSAAELTRAMAAVRAPARPGQSEALRQTIASLTPGARELSRQADLDQQEREFHRVFKSATPGAPAADGDEAPTRPALPQREASAEREVWFDELRRDYLDSRRPTATSTVVQLIKSYPRRVAAGVVLLLLILLVGFSEFLRGGEAPDPRVDPARSETRSPSPPAASSPQPAVEAGKPGDQEQLAGRLDSAPAVTSPPPAAAAAVILISDDPQLTSLVFERLRAVADVAIRTSLAEASGAAGGGARFAIRLSATTQSGTLEAYETLVPTCRVAASGQLLALPGGSVEFARTVESTAPQCGVAIARAAGELSAELSAALEVQIGR